MQQENKRWYPRENDYGNWIIEDINGADQLSKYEIDYKQAEENARLCASSPEMRELLRDMYVWMEGYIQTPGQYDRNSAIRMMQEYKQIEKEYGLQ